MLQLKTILVPIDFSERSLAAAEHAGAVASRFGAKLIFLHVVPVSPYEYGNFESGLYVGSQWPSEGDLRKKLQTELARVTEVFSPVSEVEHMILKGDPPVRIEQVVKEKGVDLIVMPTHGYGPFRRFVLGSVTTKVLHDIACPILTGAHVAELLEGDSTPYRRIACALDLREGSKDLLQWAWEFAQAFDAELSVIHAAPALDAEPTDGQYFTQKLVQMLIHAKEKEVRELIGQVGCKCAVLVDSDDVTRYVPQAAREAEADLLVMGRSPLRGVLGRLRTHAHALIREAPCPVISV